MVEQRTHKPLVAGSKPAAATTAGIPPEWTEELPLRKWREMLLGVEVAKAKILVVNNEPAVTRFLSQVLTCFFQKAHFAYEESQALLGFSFEGALIRLGR